MKIFTHYGLLLLLTGLCSIPLHATQGDFLTASSLFTQMDADKDGVIKPDEINKQSMLSNEFNNVDRNSDGVLDPLEFEIFIVKTNI